MKNKTKQKRSMFNHIFGKQSMQQSQQYTNVRMLNGGTITVSHYNGAIINNPIVASCVDTICKHFAKMTMTHTCKGNTVNDALNQLLTVRPNDLMSPYDFLYKVCSLYLIDNNAYVYVQRNATGTPVALYPIQDAETELKEDQQGSFYLKFTFNGSTITEPLGNIIMLRNHYNKNEFIGGENINPLYHLVDMLYQVDQLTMAGLKNSAEIRGILSLTGTLQDDDLQEKRDTFNNQFLNSENNGGVAVVDGKMEYKPINFAFNPIDSKNINLFENKIYDYFGVSPEIIKGTYTDGQWNAFFSSTLQPMAKQFEEEFTYKLFSEKEVNIGNKVDFNCDLLGYMSPDSKTKMFTALKDMAVMNKDTITNVFHLPAVPDGDKIMQSLNYVDSNVANQYQLGKNGQVEEGGE